jgi:TRAP-type C4-dicarboxylate transport system permease small subunit
MSLSNLDMRVRRTLRVLCIILSIAVTVLMVAEIAARYFFTHAFRGLPEIYLLLVMWLYMLGAGLASANSSHLRIGIMGYLVKTPRAKYLYNLIVSGLCLVIAGYFIWWASGLIQWAFIRPQTTPILRMPWVTSQASIMVASLLVGIYALRDFVKAVRGPQNEEASAQPQGEAA